MDAPAVASARPVAAGFHRSCPLDRTLRGHSLSWQGKYHLTPALRDAHLWRFAVCKNSEIHFFETLVTGIDFVQYLSCKLLQTLYLHMHQELGKVYKSLKSGDL